MRQAERARFTTAHNPCQWQVRSSGPWRVALGLAGSVGARGRHDDPWWLRPANYEPRRSDLGPVLPSSALLRV